MSIFYMALTDGTTTLVLTDGVNFSVDEGWAPGIAIDVDQRTVIDQIPINVLGAPTAGGVSDKGKVRANYLKLLTMLRQIERGQGGDGGVVTLIYTSPNSAPARRIACQVTRCDMSTLPVDLNAAENLVTHTIENVLLTLEHRVPWVWQSYLYANLLANSAWSTTPTPTAILGTAAYAASAGVYGGAGLIRLTHTTGGTSSIYPSVPTIAVVSGVPVTVTWSAGWSASMSNMMFVLVDSASTTVRSSSVNNATSGTSSIATDGRRFSATVTPTITGNVRLFWQMTANNGTITEIAEVFAHATVEETWHLDAALEGVAAITTAAHPIDATVTIPASQALADTKLAISGFPSGGTYPTALGPILAVVGPPAAAVISYPFGAVPTGIWTGVADAARLAQGGFVTRATPVAANTWYAEPGGAAVTMLTAMAVGTPQTLTRQLQIIVVCVNNSATATFSLYARGYSGQGSYTEGRSVDIPPNGADPQHIVMPVLYHDLGFYDYQLYVSSSIAGQTFDIDRVIAYGVNEETTTTLSNTNYSLTQTGVITFDPQTLTRPQPALLAEISGGGTARLSSKDSAIVRTRTGSVQLIVDAISDGLWQIAAAGAVTPLQATLTRPPAFDAPI